MSGRVQARDAIHSSIRRHAERSQQVVRATVVSEKPLVVQPFHLSYTLTEDDDLDLSGSMKLYQHVVGFKTDDLVLLHQTESWVLFDVVTDTDVVGAFKKAGLHG